MKRVTKTLTIFAFSLICLFSFFLSHGSNKAKAVPSGSNVTYSNQVVRIFQETCQECHRPNGVAPFSLLTYQEVLPYAQAIKEDVISKKMPSGASVRLEGCTTVDTFTGQRRLIQSEIDTIVEWINNGAPEGDRAMMPPPRKFIDGVWKAGDPDLNFPNDPKGFTIPANVNRDIFRNFVIPIDFENDRFITSIEVLPGLANDGSAGEINDPTVKETVLVHHVLLHLDPTGQSLVELKKFQDNNPGIPGPGYEAVNGVGFDSPLLAQWFPGAAPLELPQGIGIKIPKGSYLVMQVHYGGKANFLAKPLVDQTRIGIKFARQPIVKERFTMPLRNESFKIPAGDPAYQVTATKTLTEDVTIDTTTPHSHILATRSRTEAILPNGQKMCVVDVDWTLENQNSYVFKKPLKLPAGTVLNMTVTYDNSAENPRQFNFPPKDIPFGRVAFLEMCQNVFGLTRDNQVRTPSAPVIGTAKVKKHMLTVSGTGIDGGAFLEVNGKLLLDTKLSNGVLVSAGDWRKVAPRDQDSNVVIINPDGARTQVSSFRRN